MILAAAAGTPAPAGASPAMYTRKVKPVPEYRREYRLALKDAAFSDKHSVLLLENGTLRCTGYNGDKECEAPPGLTDLVQVVAGNGFSAARSASGNVFLWGRKMGWPEGRKARSLVVDDDDAFGAILDDGNVWLHEGGIVDTGGAKLTKLSMHKGRVWVLAENGTLSELKVPDTKLIPVTDNLTDFIVAGMFHANVCGLTKSRTLWTETGPPEFGMGPLVSIDKVQGGHFIGTASNKYMVWPADGYTASKIDSGVKPSEVKFIRSRPGMVMMALKNGRALVWGQDNCGSLLLGPPSKPKKISSYSDQIYLVIREDGEVVPFGEDLLDGGNMTGPYFPVCAGGVKDAKTFGGTFFAVTDHLWTYGIDDEGLLDIPQGLKQPQQVDTGMNWALVRTAEGKLTTWGERAQKFKLPDTKRKCIAAAAGFYHGVSLYDDGSLHVWGDLPGPGFGAAGALTPPADLPTNIKDVAAGQAHTLVLTANGRVFAWGANASMQCDVPEGLQDVVAITAGEYESYSAALLKNGRVRVWGTHAQPADDVPDLVAIEGGMKSLTGVTRSGNVVIISGKTGKASSPPLFGVFDRK